MAFTIAKIVLTSGLELTQPLLVISELNVSNNASLSERLDIVAAPMTPIEDSNEAPDNKQSYTLLKTNHGGRGCNAIVSVFINQTAFEAGKPPVDFFKDDHNIKVFSIPLDNPEFDGMTPREAAYAHVLTLPEFDGAKVVDGLAV